MPAEAETNDRAVQRIIEQVERAGLDAEDLDGFVHDAFSNRASKINNGGVGAQIEFLVNAYGPAQVRAMIEANRPVPPQPAPAHGSPRSNRLDAAVVLYETRGFNAVVSFRGRVWDLGPVTPDMEGRFMQDAEAAAAGDLSRFDELDPESKDMSYVEHMIQVALRDPRGPLMLLVDPDTVLRGAADYLGEFEED